MDIAKINNSPSFSAKFICTPTFNEAVMCAKNAKGTDLKYTFYNALSIIHEASEFKNFKIETISSDAKKILNNKFKIQAEKQNGDVFSYTTSVLDKDEEGVSAVKSIIDFIEKFYGHKTASYARLSRKFPSIELNSRIDGVLTRNVNKYDTKL